MRFLRMRPAVWAMISCSFSSLTRKVAFGSNSVTTPGNSRSSSLAIRYPAFCKQGQADRPAPEARKLAESGRFDNLLIAAAAREEARPDPRHQLIAHGPISVE